MLQQGEAVVERLVDGGRLNQTDDPTQARGSVARSWPGRAPSAVRGW